MSKYFKILYEFIINLISFSALIVTQQILCMPIISSRYESVQFGNVILLFSIGNIITNMIGFSIGSGRLLNKNAYSIQYLKIFLKANLIFAFLGFFIFLFALNQNLITSIFFIFIVVLGNIRYFYLSEFRINDQHMKIFLQNIFYVIGSGVGILIFLYISKNWTIVFLSAELSTVVYSYLTFKKKTYLLKFNKSKIKLYDIYHLMFNNGLGYVFMYYDRLIIYPILGSTKLGIYYSSAVAAKLGSMVINPLSNYILGKIHRAKDKELSKIINYILKITVVLIIAYFSVSYIITPYIVKILYPENLDEVKKIYFWVCLGNSLLGGIAILKPLVLKVYSTKKYNQLYILYGILLFIISIVLCIKFNLLGVAYAYIIANILMLTTIISILLKQKNCYGGIDCDKKI